MTPLGIARQLSALLRSARCGLRTDVRTDNQQKGDAQVIVYEPIANAKRGEPRWDPIASIDIDLDLQIDVRGTDDVKAEAVRLILKRGC